MKEFENNIGRIAQSGDRGMSTEYKGSGEKYFVYREAESAEELCELFRLRYRVYRNSHLVKFVHENELGFEVDAYDFRSRHFGLFEVADGTETPIGYLRVVEDNDLSQQPQLTGLIAKYGHQLGCISSQVSAPFPIMTYSPDTDLLLSKYQQIRFLGERLVEPTRMSLDEGHRSLRMARLLFECSEAVYFFALGFDHVFACCDSSKKAFYHVYEWNYFPGTEEGDFAGLGESSTCLFGSAARTPAKVKPRILAMAEAFTETGRIYYHPTNSELYYDRPIASQVDVPVALTAKCA
jgi:hypothetical protein